MAQTVKKTKGKLLSKSKIDKKVKEPQKIKVFKPKKMLEDFLAKVKQENLTVLGVMNELKVCEPLAKAFLIGILPDSKSEKEILRYLNKSRKDYTF